MSVRIHWRPTNEATKFFSGGTSTDLAKLKDVFGDVIPETAGDILRAMSIAADIPFFDEVADIVDKVGAIEIWGVY